jgi:NTP pyrophosphatase (non-canonical NTP hydrolase)
MTPEQTDIMQRAVAKYGAKAQTNKAVEELAELIRAITRYETEQSDQRRLNLIEELADVKIMIEEVIMINRISQEAIQNDIKVKLNRLDYNLNQTK